MLLQETPAPTWALPASWGVASAFGRTVGFPMQSDEGDRLVYRTLRIHCVRGSHVQLQALSQEQLLGEVSGR